LERRRLLSPELRWRRTLPSKELQVRWLVRKRGRWQVAVEVATFSILKVRQPSVGDHRPLQVAERLWAMVTVLFSALPDFSYTKHLYLFSSLCTWSWLISATM